ncbi:MAG: helix-hairpin-helix domain-containing protein [Candidatus Omnitrophica bacterium]|nr:helix-hairpin-helix domain-containing protein [Candidatus Omnitrophota bacterium]MBU1128112.1 helix-hairpin-helix domain-containing protein [Candidatus Omnitrophota bacterium]MBU1784506.1 helix-hairpin-helix domain-containing protein [Candidatus Omnitrophota bacterium]MBU1851094.1 helix-hairpin-helix domain-containing protein [Candidatus Omnitrophota bacterium]
MAHPEKTAFIALSVILFILTVFLHVKSSRVCHDIMIAKDGTRRTRTLREIDRELRESRRISVNTATQTELTLIPGIGDKFAAEIAEYRSAYGPFRQPRDIMAVKGIGPSRFAEMREFIKIE